jgi:molybdopterin-guanine dinucleotide biosynthesis protein A
VTLACVVGIFVGGQSSRMGGFPKGNLKAPGSELTLLERSLVEIREAAPNAEVVLVGRSAPYASLSCPALADQPAGVGPIGGLAALLDHAAACGKSHALALACDLPRLDRELLRRLLNEQPAALALFIQQGTVRNPLIARYAVAATRAAVDRSLAANRYSLQAVLDQLEPGLATLTLSRPEAASFDDWDSPSDLER